MIHRRRRPVRGTAEEEAEEVASRVDDAASAGRLDAAPDALADVRLHTGDRAAHLTAALGAQAVTVGSNVYLSPQAPPPTSRAGKRLLAHELTHVVQQRQHGARPQCFEASERAQIANDLGAMMGVVTALVGASCRGDAVDMDALVRHAGGRTAMQAAPESMRSDAPLPYLLTLRYLFTRRCGLIDMRHFFQIMYISWFTNMGNARMASRGATRRGIEHEEHAEARSAFAPEDITSNALGAWTAERLAGLPQRNDLIARVRETLELCGPVAFDSLSASSRDAVVDFYAAKAAGGEPLRQNRTAVALIPDLPELASADRSFPFDLDTDDPRRATLEGPTFGGGPGSLTSDTDIRRFVAVQRESVLAGLSHAERLRMCSRLLRGWVSDDDIEAFTTLYRGGDAAARAAIRTANPPATLSTLGQRQRLRLLYASEP